MKNTKNISQNKARNNQLDWDLEAILEGKPFGDLYEKYVKARKQIISTYAKGACYASLKSFRAYTKSCDVYAVLSNRLWNYISNKLSENVTDAEWISWRQKISVEDQELDQALADEVNAVLKHEKEIRKYLKEHDLQQRTRLYEQMFRYREHILSKNEEKFISKLEPDGFDSGGIHQVLTSADIKFDPAVTKKGRKIAIGTETKAFILMKNRDVSVRKSAWLSLQRAFRRHEKTISKLLFYNYLSCVLDSKLRKFDNFVTAQAFDDEVNQEFIYFVHQQVKQYAKTYRRLGEVSSSAIAKKYKIKRIRAWDHYLELFHAGSKYSVDEAKELAVEALGCLGEEYLTRIKKALNEKWISWLPKPNKESGAYSVGGVLGLPKFYVFLNYDESLDGVFALVHELGHSMHSTYQVDNQTIYCATDTFCAEIASTINEILLGLHLLDVNKDKPKLQAMVYRRILDNFFGSTSVQAMYSALELGIVDAIEKNNPVTPETLYRFYLQTSVDFAGMSQKRCDKLVSKRQFGGLTGIFRVEHFYAGDLYVYKYAVAMVVALRVAQLLYARDEQTLQKYFRFLSLGTSLPPLEIIASLGVDVRSPEVWREAGAFASKLLSEYIALLKRLKLN